VKPVFVQPNLDGPAIELSDVAVHVGRTPLVSGVDWRVAYGERWVVLGRNGAGKSTILSVASTQRFPSAGRAVATHALPVRRGRVTAAGPIDDVLTGEGLSACYEREVDVHRINGRWAAQARRR
jgi:ABC-type hemin transport system ATPase subunit